VLLAAACTGDSTGDVEVDLNTGVGSAGGISRRESVALPTTLAPPTSEGAPTSTEGSSPPGSKPAVATSGPTVASSTVATTAQMPCSDFDPAGVEVVVAEESWSLRGPAVGGVIASVSAPLDGPAPRLLGGAQLDDDPVPELLVASGDPAVALVSVYDADGCDLREPLDTLSGQPVRLLVGVAAEEAGAVACDGQELIVSSFSRQEADDAEGDTQVRWVGQTWALSLFSGSWERSEPVPVTHTESELAAVAGVHCSTG
jgi:hypothetical protein